jgi:hypothetical protein
MWLIGCGIEKVESVKHDFQFSNLNKDTAQEIFKEMQFLERR